MLYAKGLRQNFNALNGKNVIELGFEPHDSGSNFSMTQSPATITILTKQHLQNKIK